MSWTDDRVALLKKLWGEGKTAAEIASELGGVTRNAVIGKAHRMKLSNRVSPIQQNKKIKKAAEAASAAPTKAPAAANTSVPPAPAAEKPVVKRGRKKQEAPVVNKGKRLDLIELSGSMCRWPMGDPRDDNFGFCGCSAVPGLPYCAEHAAVAYQTSSRSRTLKAEDFEDKKGETQLDAVQKIAVNQ